MKRRAFFGHSLPLVGALVAGGPANAAPISKRERMQQWLAGKGELNYTPAAFFLHFAPEYKVGSAAARRHLEFFRETDMDFVKIQFEQPYERQEFLQKPSDWSKLALMKRDFYAPQLQAVRDLVKAAKKDALVLMTLYSPFMSAGQCATAPVRRRHLEEDPEAVKRGLDILVESQLIFVRACIAEGVDGFYMSTQGSETNQFTNPKIFTDYIKPADLVAMKVASEACAFNILHVCDYNSPYSSYESVRDYPGHVVNCNTKFADGEISPQEISKLFRRPYMGGMDRHGILAKGSPLEVEREIQRVVKAAPRQFILGADCTVDGETDWKRLRHAISVAHRVGA